ncbi:MAG: hypothetical protein OXC69_04095, partial [Candidatus Tectomicrobia bacterium]|nr:hypothetical protein [Candidatus Tectomicrobia bacterium]
LFWLTIMTIGFIPLLVLASDNPHVETCTRLVSDAKKSTTDPDDTVTNCILIIDSHKAACIELMVNEFNEYQITESSVYDGFDSNHIFACSFFKRHSSVTCLKEMLTQRHPAISDIRTCSRM